jgi:uncharacterized membrane protein
MIAGSMYRWLLSVTAVTLTTLIGTTSLSAATATRSDASAGSSAERFDQRGIGLRGHGFVRDAGNGVTTVDVPGASSYTVTFGIDTQGRTVGGYVDARGRTHGFVQNRSGDFIRIDFPRAGLTFATRINKRGQIVGMYADDPNTPALRAPRGFLLEKGKFTKIDVPGARETRPFGISNHGQIVGEYVDADGRLRGFLLDDATFTTIDAPYGASTSATDIDDNGRIVGTSRNADPASQRFARGFVRDAQGVFTSIDAPAAPPPPGRPEFPQTEIFGINNHGQFVGLRTDSEGVRPFLFENGAFTVIEVPQAVDNAIALALDVDDRGRIVGGYDLTGHGVLQTARGQFITLDHPEGIGETILTGSNNRGQITLFILDASGTGRGFLRDKRRFIEIEVPGALASGPGAINDRGQVVGTYSTLTRLNHAFPVRGYLWHRGELTLVDFPDAVNTVPNDIDNSGRIVGEYVDQAGVGHGFVREADGRFSTLDVPGAVSSSIQSINERGQMVGTYLDAAGGFHGYLREGDVITTLDAPGSVRGTQPLAINNRGAIVGWYFGDTSVQGFVFENGRFTTTGTPGALNQSLPLDIDDRGRIVGTYL